MSVRARVNFKIPGKTFLLGEYAAVFGGPSLVLTTNPSFEIFFRLGKGEHPFHENSPAGRFISAHHRFFQHWDIGFGDPYKSGGFGASTAQFIAVNLFLKFESTFAADKSFFLKPEDILGVWDDYQELFKGQKNPPSGADLVAQMGGGLVEFTGRELNILEWPFADKDVLLFKTNNKVPTHEHLKEWSADQGLISQLKALSEKGSQSLKSSSWEAWQVTQKEFSSALKAAGLAHPDTELLLKKITQIPGVLGARGCGALGADVIAVTIDKNRMTEIMAELSQLQFVSSLLNDKAYGPLIEVM